VSSLVGIDLRIEKRGSNSSVILSLSKDLVVDAALQQTESLDKLETRVD
jgi:hypothetical protein